MPAPITLPPLDKQQQADLQQHYEEATDAETRTRYQMLVLAELGHTAPHIADLVLRSEDTVARVLKRFLAGGLDAVPRRTSPGRGRTITSAWEAELLRVIELDPHVVGQETANWTRRFARRLLGPADRSDGHARDGACLLACAWLCVQATDLDVTSAVPKRKRTTWEKTAGRGVISRNHST
jgi:transposase